MAAESYHPEILSEQTGVFAVSPGDWRWEAGAEVEAERFIQEGYFASRQELDEAYAPYMESSRMIVFEYNGEIQAAARLIMPNSSIGLKTLDDLADESVGLSVSNETWRELFMIGPDKLVDFATISVPKRPTGYNALKRSSICIGGAAAEAQSAGATHMIGGMDEKAYGAYSRLYGNSFREIGEPADYYGSRCYPVLIDVEESLRSDVGWVRQATHLGHEAVIVGSELELIENAR